MENITFFGIPSSEKENSVLKNRFLSEAGGQYIGIIDENRITAEEIERVSEAENLFEDYKVIAFCAGQCVEAAEITFPEILNCCTQDIVALVFQKELLNQSGWYNEKLETLTDFELLCRLAERAGKALFFVLEKEETLLEVTEKDLVVYSYLLRRYMSALNGCGMTETVLNLFFQLAQSCGLETSFKNQMNAMLSENGLYEKYAWETAPYAVFRGDETCYGVLQDFADSFSESMLELGRPILMLEAGQIDYEYLQNYICRGVVGFQAAAMGLDFFKKQKGIKAQFWLDNPVFYKDALSTMPKDCMILCQDENYARYIREQYHFPGAVQFPPGGHAQTFVDEGNRPYDIVFVGGFWPEADSVPEGFEKQFYEYMINHPRETFSTGLTRLSEISGITLTGNKLSEQLTELKSICQRVINHYRKKVIDTILEAGYRIHVYGATWERYHSPWENRLIKHPEVTVGESLVEWQKAKIGLNIMSWHKAGMTERVANIMLAGAVCLSDETAYLKTHFAEGEEIAIYRLDELTRLPEQIAALLENDRWKTVAEKGRQKALTEHTWKKRAEEFDEMAKKIIFSSSLFGKSIR